MSEETIYESETKRSRRGIASYLRRIARRLGQGEPAPVDEDQTVTVDPPAETEFEVELERDDGTVSLDIEMSWDENDGAVETDVHASKATFELYEDSADEWRWRLVHDNGNVIADGGEGYERRADARNGSESVATNAAGAALVDESKTDEEAVLEPGASDATFELYEDAEEKWRWRLVHDNGNVIADGGQGYASKQKAKQGLRSVRTNAPGAAVEAA